MNYQNRYLEHQARKKEQLAYSIGTKDYKAYTDSEYNALQELLKRRRSQRIFIKQEIPEDILKKVLESATMAPNSCNRHGILLKVVSNQTDKDLLTGILVGGVGWIHRADKIILFLADPIAYASPNEKEFMHYCDMGFKATNMWLTAETLNLGAAYINPNIREENKDLFKERFGGEYIFCGALVLGYYDDRVLQADRPNVKDIVI